MLTALGLITLAACAPTDSQQPPAPPLDDTSWILTGVAGDSGISPAIDSSGSLNFGADGSLSGSTGCNRFTGTWSAADGLLTLRPGPMTMMACPGGLDVQESRVIAALAATDSYTVGDGVLTLRGGDTALAEYAATVSSLAGTSWSATGVNNGQGGVVSTSATADLTLAFSNDSTVSGFGGCSDYRGTYTETGTAIAISGLVAASSCADPLQAQFLAALQSATQWSIDGNRLDLRDATGALQAGFSAG